MTKLIDLTGQRFGRLTVCERATQNRKAGQSMWVCRCKCGNVCIKGSYELRTGRTKSCGCLMLEWQAAPPPNRTHGLSGSRLHRIWAGMKDRCSRPGNIHYADYGGKGIQVCHEWKSSFEKFAVWASQSGYAENLTLDRIDPSKDYSPDNCRWASRKEQSRNRRCVRYLTYQGETKPLWEWAEIKNIPLALLSSRMSQGWSAERIFNEPVHAECRKHRRKKE